MPVPSKEEAEALKLGRIKRDCEKAVTIRNNQIIARFESVDDIMNKCREAAVKKYFEIQNRILQKHQQDPDEKNSDIDLDGKIEPDLDGKIEPDLDGKHQDLNDSSLNNLNG